MTACALLCIISSYCHPYPQLQLRGSRLEKQASCQPRGRMSSIFSDGARTSPLAFEDAGCRSEVTPSGGALGGSLLSMSASSNTNSNANSVSLLVAEHLSSCSHYIHSVRAWLVPCKDMAKVAHCLVICKALHSSL